MNSLVIIGAGGFVGTRLIETLVLEGFTNFCGIVRGFHSFAPHCRFGPRVELRMADATDHNQLADAIKGFSVVVNLVSGNPTDIQKSTQAIYRACIISGVKRFIHISSAVVYGMVDSPEINDDSPPVKGLWSPYAKAKAASEVFLRERLGSSTLEICVLRPSIIWGPRSIWSLSAAKDLIDGTAFLVGNGDGICNTIYIDNLIACILTCVDHPGNASGFFNVSDLETISWKQFYESLAQHCNYDMAKIPTVAPDRFRPSLQTRFEDLKSSRIYSTLKDQIPQETRAHIKAWLQERLRRRDRAIAPIDAPPPIPKVTRQMWELQSTRRKLSNAKFLNHFKHTTPVSFAEGTLRTIEWLKFIGINIEHRAYLAGA